VSNGGSGARARAKNLFILKKMLPVDCHSSPPVSICKDHQLSPIFTFQNVERLTGKPQKVKITNNRKKG
jgi:hypothetical protein